RRCPEEQQTMNDQPASRTENLTAFVNAASGVIVVVVALCALGVMTSYMVSAVNSDDAKLALGSAALGVIGTIIGAYFGIKVASDTSKNAQQQTNAANQKDQALKDALNS